MVDRVHPLSAVARQALRALIPLGILTGLACAGAGGAYLLYLDPLQTRLSQAEQAYTEARQEQARLEVIRETRERLAELWGTLPARTDFTPLSVEIADLAKQHRIGVPGMNYTLEDLDSDHVVKGNVTFQAAGPYASIRRLIYDLETSRPYLHIEELTATRARQDDHVAFNIRLVMFLKTRA